MGGRLALLVWLSSIGCTAATTETLPIAGPGSPLASSREAIDPFPYERAAVRVTNHTEREAHGYAIRLLQYPASGDNGQSGNTVTVRYYESSEPGPRPLVLVLPIWGGNAYPQAVVVSDLVASGRFNVMLVLGDDSVMDWGALGGAPTPAAFENEFRRMIERVRTWVIDLRRLLDWAETRPAVAAGSIGVIGFSESTLQVTGLMASDPRVAAAVLLMGGAHPHEIFGTCYGPPGAVRREISARFGWTREQLVERLRPLTESIDADRLGSRVDAQRVLMFEAGLDDCMPSTARDALWRALGYPLRITVPSTHAGAFLGLTFLRRNYMRRRIVEFLGHVLPSPDVDTRTRAGSTP